jgi:hypothetical protein
MTLDSLVKTFSVTSALLVINEMSSQPPRSKSIVDIENEISQIERDSLNKNCSSDRIKVQNSAKNINCNEQINVDKKAKTRLNHNQER